MPGPDGASGFEDLGLVRARGYQRHHWPRRFTFSGPVFVCENGDNSEGNYNPQGVSKVVVIYDVH